MPAYQCKVGSIYMIFKCGNQVVSDLKGPNFGYKDGMLIEVIDPLEFSNPADVWISEWMQKCFAIAEGRAMFKDQVRALCQPSGVIPILADQTDPSKNGQLDIPNQGTFRRSRGWVDFEEMQSELGIPDLAGRLRRRDSIVNVIPVVGRSLGLIKDTALTDFTKRAIPDENLVTTGTYTYGSGGGDNYTTRALAYADAGNLTGNLTFQQNSNTTETTKATISVNLGGFEFKDTNNSYHNGDTSAGYASTYTQGGANDFINLTAEGPGTQTIEKLRLVTGAVYSVNQNAILVSSISTECTVNVQRLFLDHNGYSDRIRCMFFTTANVTVNVSNCLISRWRYSGVVFFTAAPTVATIENCSVDGSGGSASTSYCYYGNNYSVITWRNCLSFGGTNITGWSAVTNNTARNCASDDATADDATTNSGCLVNIDVPRAIMSFDPTRSDFLRAKYDGLLARAGVTTTISDNTSGIRGNVGNRGGSTPCIGADEADNADFHSFFGRAFN